MEFEWDQAKNNATLERRGFDFEFASEIFRDPFRIEREDLRRDYGERRYQIFGEIDGRVYFVAFTRRGQRIRIISARRARDNEIRTYRESET